MAETIEFDLDTLTLGELVAAETASGLDSSILLARSAHRRMLAVFVSRLRSSGSVPNWNELADLRVVEAFNSTSPSSPDGDSATSEA
jgi:hypothetical protein